MNIKHLERSRRILQYAAFLLPLIDVSASFADAPQAMGPATCASSNCHGAAAPRNVTNVLQNEYITWLKHDQHAQAYKALLSEESKTIARHLGIPHPETDKLCLACHATLPDGAKGAKFQIEDGVSCEACHGAAEKWLAPHAEKGATHARNVELGLAEIASASQQAGLCLTCHYGTKDKSVTHRLLGAGHPRLTFELDTFASIEPRHWSLDEDYAKRKGEYAPFAAWISSQLVRSQSSLEQLSSKERSFMGAFPDFALFYCSSCHHSLKGEEWKSRDYHGAPGEVRLNVSSLKMLSIVLHALKSQKAAQLDSLIAKAQASPIEGDMTATSKEVLAFVHGELPKALASTRDKDGLGATYLPALIAYGAENENPTYEVAEQILMGISAALAEHPKNESSLKPLVDKAYETLKDPRDFDPAPFTAALLEMKGVK